jgi:YfiH family protein
VLVDPSPNKSVAAEADALVLRAGGAAGVRTADCASILLGDKHSGAVAAVHAGWRGVVAGVLPAAVRALVGTRTGGLRAALGPCIGPCCFEVGTDVADALSAACGADVTRPGRRERPHADLGAAVLAQLAALGVQAVERVGGCTVCAPDGWHSYRRDGARSGRMLAVIAASQR